MNAIILAAGTSSRFVPLSYDKPKGLLEVKGEVLIERQIRQLNEAGIYDIIIVVGYKSEQFEYLKEKYGVRLVFNEDYSRYNNTSSLIRVIEELGESYICSSDNYFPENVFLASPANSYYSALFSEGETKEYCLITDMEDRIIDVKIGGCNAWYMIGHVFFDKDFSKKFREIMKKEYVLEETRMKYWEDVYIQHIHQLPLMKINRYLPHSIEEFDSLDELRKFDGSYVDDTRSSMIKSICAVQGWKESELSNFRAVDAKSNKERFFFDVNKDTYCFDRDSLQKIVGE